MNKLVFINETLVVPFEVKVWNDVVFSGTIRPPTVAEVQAYDRAISSASDPVARRCDFYAKHLKSWNYSEGEPTAENIAKVHPAVFSALDGIIFGGVGCKLTADAIVGKSAG